MEDYYSREDLDSIVKKWCACPIRNSEPWIANQFFVSANLDCPLCNKFVSETHKHCGYCTKLTRLE